MLDDGEECDYDNSLFQPHDAFKDLRALVTIRNVDTSKINLHAVLASMTRIGWVNHPWFTLPNITHTPRTLLVRLWRSQKMGMGSDFLDIAEQILTIVSFNMNPMYYMWLLVLLCRAQQNVIDCLKKRLYMRYSHILRTMDDSRIFIFAESTRLLETLSSTPGRLACLNNYSDMMATNCQITSHPSTTYLACLVILQFGVEIVTAAHNNNSRLAFRYIANFNARMIHVERITKLQLPPPRTARMIIIRMFVMYNKFMYKREPATLQTAVAVMIKGAKENRDGITQAFGHILAATQYSLLHPLDYDRIANVFLGQSIESNPFYTILRVHLDALYHGKQSDTEAYVLHTSMLFIGFFRSCDEKK